ncbi:MAG TPA: penicillin-binding protein [bacterium]|jgi:cell division protein FtsI/penicillin-binding protein 2
MSEGHRKVPRERFLACVLLAILCAFGMRLVQLQVFQHGQWQTIARNQSMTTKYQKPSRGEIRDKNGLTLAVTLPLTYAVGYRPQYALDMNALAGTLSTYLQKPKREMREKLETTSFTYLARRVDWQTKEKLEALNLSCLQFDEEPRRAYPSNTYASTVVGFTNRDGKGMEGVEGFMNDELSGEGYQELCRVDALREASAALSPAPVETKGADITLTIDLQLQTIVEEKMREGLKDRTFERACAVMVDPQTGAVLALSTYPSFDPNQPGDGKADYRRCWPVTDVYEPGSIFKIVAISKALESGRFKRTSLINCEGGKYSVGGITIHDSHAHGTISVDDVLAYSSNIGTAKIARAFSPAEIYDKVRAYGFGNLTLVGIPMEQPGEVPVPERWSGSTQATVAFGQGISCTALQVTMAYAAVANGGLLMKPRLVQSVRFPSGAHTDYPAEIIRRVMPAEIASQINEMLVNVVEYGTGTKAKVDGMRIAGKTGTAEKVDYVHHTYFKGRFMSSFVGFFPAEHPQYVLLITVDDPRGEHYGGSVAGPIFKAIVEDMRMMSTPSPAPSPSTTPVPLEMTVNHSTQKDASSGRVQPPRTAAYVPVSLASVTTYQSQTTTDSTLVAVPSLQGWSLRPAVEELSKRKLSFKLLGSRTVVTQFPPAGTMVPVGTVCELYGVTE